VNDSLHCPACGATVVHGAAMCSVCRTSLDWPDPDEPARPPAGFTAIVLAAIVLLAVVGAALVVLAVAR
jgi:hypothetical protein